MSGISRKRRNDINRIAEAIRKACKIKSPADMHNVVSQLGGELKINSNCNDFEAKIERADSDTFIISIVDGNHTEERKRFSIAHELGHLFLHMGYWIDETKWKSTEAYIDSVYYRYGHSKEESEANEFAAAFLMPDKEFKMVCRQNYSGSGYKIAEIAEYFQVSIEAARNRGRWLGIFSWD